MLPKLQYISQGATAPQQLEHIRKVLDLGCKWIQLRFKQQEQIVLVSLAETVKQLCAAYDAMLIINDHVNIAKEVAADGVHLGLSDTPVAVARQTLEAGKIIGGTANTLDDVRQRIREGCDYIGLGPYRFTATKEKLSPVLGLEGYRQLFASLSATERTVPIYAIGGILKEDIPALLDAGLYGIAVSGLLTHTVEPIDCII
ncbi:thiamine phosphate synthase [Taibaiella koreensis]|uniref:thiamine phosphate synthase n=1 Tax=Taibaiella koreensis TaxID=1268548 RepID=UPI000E5A0A86|nr:thiamine phosphate synthase [Taibaiella koreensis]